MIEKPCAGSDDNLLQRAGLLEKVRRAGHDFETRLAGHESERFTVKFEHVPILTADKQQRRRPDAWQGRAGEVRAPATRDDGGDCVGLLGGRDQSRCGSGARAKQPKRKAANPFFLRRPSNSLDNSFGQQGYIEDIVPISRLLLLQKIEQQAGEIPRDKLFCNVNIART